MTATGEFTRICTACKTQLPATLEFFVKQKAGKFGITATCKKCRVIASDAWNKANPEKTRLAARKRYAKDPSKDNAANAVWRAKNPEKAKATQAAWIAKNRERYDAQKRAYYQANTDKIKARYAVWYAANREAEIASAAARRAANPDKDRENARKWYAENKAQGRASRDAWLAANPEKKRAYSENRRARKLGSSGQLSADIVTVLLKLQDGKCACCGESLTEYHLDHRMPLALGGAHADENMQLLTPRCNMMKGSRHPDEYMKYRESLKI
jgi:5-methylcytosine-specific restriction endonuclease McrA